MLLRVCLGLLASYMPTAVQSHHGGVAYELCSIRSNQLQVIDVAANLLLHRGC